MGGGAGGFSRRGHGERSEDIYNFTFAFRWFSHVRFVI